MMRFRVFVQLAAYVLATITSQAPAGAAIAGRVTFASGAPATGLSIICQTRDRSADSSVADYSVITDDDGVYRCKLPAGIYRIRAIVPGDDTQYLSQEFGASAGTTDGRMIRVRAGENVTVDLVLSRAAIISGRVVDPEGKPVRYAKVFVDADPADNAGARISTRGVAVTTGDQARFSVAGLAPGAYRVSIEPPEATRSGEAGKRLLRTYYPSASSPRNSMPLQVGAGDELGGLELVLRRGTPPSVSGRVLRSDGSPAAGANVTLAQRSRSLTGTSLERRSTRADDSGEFRLSAVDTGSYELFASVAQPISESLFMPLVVDEPDVESLTLVSRIPQPVTGRVRFDGSDHPPTSANVRAVGEADDAVSMNAQTTGNGRFELTVPGRRVLRVTPLPKGWWLKAVTGDDLDITNRPIDFTDGAQNIEILLSRRMASIAGTIDNAGQELPADAAVFAFSSDSAAWGPVSTAVARIWPHDDGSFAVEGLPAGTYHVIAVDQPPGRFMERDAEVLSALATRATSVMLRDEERRSIVLPLIRRCPPSGPCSD